MSIAAAGVCTGPIRGAREQQESGSFPTPLWREEGSGGLSGVRRCATTICCLVRDYHVCHSSREIACLCFPATPQPPTTARRAGLSARPLVLLRYLMWYTMDMESIHVPKASSDPVAELEIFLRPFLHLFRRKYTVQSMERYVTGLLTDLQRKNCETIAGAVAGSSPSLMDTHPHDRRHRDPAKQGPGPGLP